MKQLLVLVSTCLVVAGCGGSDRADGAGDDVAESPAATTAAAAGKPPVLKLQLVGSFDEPVDVMEVPRTDLLAVVEKGGRVRLVSGMSCPRPASCPDDPVTTGRVVLDIRGDVSDGSEQGLLGLAFHPSWPDDPRIFVNYTDGDGATRIEAWKLDGPASTARRQQELIRVEQPFSNHNGGHLAFGPDGLLYIGMGDGGSGGDPGDRAQSPDDQLGKLLRIDVDAGGGRGYGIPKGNIADGAPEVWALGLRNPWRFSFDREQGDLWIGDVGQDEREEVNVLQREQLDAGAVPNFQWRRREGLEPFDSSGAAGPGTQVPPAFDYGRDEGCSVTGGVVYRGSQIPGLRGWYLYADFCGSDVRMLSGSAVEAAPDQAIDGASQTVSFGETADGEVLVVSLGGGIRQVVAQ